MAFALWKAFQKERVFLFAVVLLADLEKTIHSNTIEKPKSLRGFLLQMDKCKRMFLQGLLLVSMHVINLISMGWVFSNINVKNVCCFPKTIQ